SCQKIKIIAMKTMLRYHGMKSPWNQYHIVVPRPDYLVQGPVFCIHLLDGIGPGFLEFIEIGLFLDRLQNVSLGIQNPFVVLVRREGTPVPRRGIDLPTDHFTAPEAGGDQIVELPCGIVPTKNNDRGFFRCYELR